MNCPKCGAVLEEDSVFCVSCGTNLKEFAEMSSNSVDPVASGDKQVPTETRDSAKKKAVAGGSSNDKWIRLIVGTVFIAIGIYRIANAGTSISSTSFGGDFYTYTYQGIVAISELLVSIEVSLGFILTAIGAAIDLSAFRC